MDFLKDENHGRCKGSHTRQGKVQSSELTAPQLQSSEFTAPRHFAVGAHHVTIIGLTRPRGCGQATWVPCQAGQSPQGPTSGFCRTIWRRINSKQGFKDIQQLHWRRLWETEQKPSPEVKMVHTRATQRESPPQGQQRGQPPSVNPVSQNAPIATAQHQQVEGVGEHNPQYPNAVANDPVTAQLNAMQQQFGVFQLVLAQLLARDNPADPLIHLLNPAPPVAPQPAQQPANSPVRSVAPTASQAQSHMPPQPQNPPQPAASDVSKRLDNIEKLLAENKNLQPQTPPISTSIPTPLNTKITQEPYLPGFRMPQFETYDGTKDPDDHLHAFFSVMQAQNASDALMCKMFPSTLRGNARTWYHTLHPNSINAYAELATLFATKFLSRRLIKKTTPELMRITQREGESLKNYMNRFNDAMLEVNAFDETVGVTAVIQGLNHDRFRDNLIKNTPTTFDEVNQRSLKFIKAEEYVLSKPQPPKEARTPAWREEGQSKKKFKPTQNRGPIPVPKLNRLGSSALQTRPRPPSWTSFTVPRSQILMQIKNKMELRRPAPLQSPAASRDHTRYCDFHQDHGHTTEDCKSLKSELESLARKGMLNEYIQNRSLQKFVKEQGQPQGSRAANNRDGKRKIDEDWKNQSVTFTSADLEGVVTPHNNPLVTSVIINNCEVQRALIDTGSAPDIMYYHCFESLGLDLALLQKYDGPIYGFNNQPVPVEGVLRLNVAFGSGRTGNQEAAKHCYMTSVVRSRNNKEIAPLPEPPHPEAPNTKRIMGVELPDNRPEDDPRATPVEEVEEVQLDDNDPSKRTQIGTRLTPVEKEELVGFLKANKDVFAWTSADMLGIPTSVAVHKLSTNPLRKPITQKRRLFGGERLTAIKEEVQKLLQAGFIRRVDYCKWIANPVMVKKSNGKWRMCIDYTNLNDACPKDCHPMPSIDKLVEAASGNERLSLLDAYSGYHQVRMAPEDEVKTSFYAGDEIYCYVMMLFGLKNAGATYQKMVTIVFRAQISRNLEVYVDDIVVKSSRAEDHLTDLAGTFNNLRRCSMKLNPAKCTFSVESGKFLGFMVSRRGIEVNPKKIKAIEEMKPPRSTKDVQRLAGRIAALHRFISKSADKCLPFFKVLRTTAQKDEAGKPRKFNWTTECQVAFDELKAYLSSPPLLTKAQEGEILYLCLEISDTAVSSVLIREMGKQQQPVYYAIELGEFQIAFQQRSAIRAQALADFVVECTSNQMEPSSEAETWILYVDGSSNSKGSGAGAVSTGLNSFRSEHALKFNFEATNNVAEYEALLLGLRLAAELKLTKIPRAENEHADFLSKLASENSGEAKSVYIEILNEPSFQTSGVMEISTDPDALSWTNPIREYILNGTVPGDKQEEMKLRRKASRYTLVGDILYKRSYSLPLLRCLTPYEAEYAIREVHEGVCGSHVGARTLAHKVLRQGYYWPNMQEDAKKFVQRYGIPNQIITDNGPQFNCNSFRDFCSSYGIKLVFTSVYHPEANGMVESVNKAILEGIKPRLDQLKTKWVDELNNILWAYRTTSRTATGETPYHLAFGTEAVIPVEIGVPSLRISHFEPVQKERLLRENLDLLDEVQEQSRLRTLAYKQRIANLYNKRVRPRNFRVGDLVLRKAGLTGFETRYGKLAPNWEGPYVVTEIPHPGAYILQDAEGKRVPRVWNVNNLKNFYP
ncbi:hypothetical protein SLEP1_g45396 [Rubroshorea leprosula]|uniref:Integrase catalytic domain-containing protein n=1 Tax=Rubroshorea leprosula TaxID=152421 RepID=A0AAV5LIV0_9ROSI|nr:hypothetical protein SLEP1_g45396 [Rubroshorea leprosula]